MKPEKLFVNILILAILIGVSFASTSHSVSAKEKGTEEEIIYTSGEYKYYLNDDGTVTICGQKGEEAELEIPSALDNYVVTIIGEEAFQYCGSVKNVVIPTSVTSVLKSAFCNCTHLYSVTIPDSVIYIGEEAFGLCFELKGSTI